MKLTIPNPTLNSAQSSIIEGEKMQKELSKNIVQLTCSGPLGGTGTLTLVAGTLSFLVGG